MYAKCSLLLAFLVTMAVTATTFPAAAGPRAGYPISYSKNNLYAGRRQSGDWQLSAHVVTKPAVKKQVVTQSLSINTGYNITYISALDQAWNASVGAYPTIVSGGPGFKYANLTFRSKIGQPINFRVNTFGRR